MVPGVFMDDCGGPNSKAPHMESFERSYYIILDILHIHNGRQINLQSVEGNFLYIIYVLLYFIRKDRLEGDIIA